MKVVYFGTPLFSARILEYLINNKIDIIAVVSKPDKPSGRSLIPSPTPVKKVAEHYEIPLFQPELVSSLDFAPVLQAFQADLFVVVAYGEIIKQHLLDMPKLGCINLHTSLLPKYRGAAPIQRAVMDGAIESGVTIIHMVKKMDAGDMIDVVKVPIGPNMTFGELEEQLCTEGASLLLQTIKNFEKGIVSRTPQVHEKMTLAPKIELEDCQIDWSKSAAEIHNLVRGVNPYPGAWCFVEIKGQKKRLKIMQTLIVTREATARPGEVASISKEGPVIVCGKNALLLVEVQLEGKKAMLASELMRGYPFSQLS